MISDITCCIHCSKSTQAKNIEDFLQFCDDSGRGCRDLWHSFVCRKAAFGETLFKSDGVDIEYEHFGLATIVHLCCTKQTKCTKTFKGHKASSFPQFSTHTKGKRKHNNSNYTLNLRSVASTLINGGSYADASRVASMLSLKGIPFKIHLFYTAYYNSAHPSWPGQLGSGVHVSRRHFE